MRVFLRVEVLIGGVERGVGVAALGQDPAVLEQVDHLGPRHEREYREEDGEVHLLGGDQLPRLLPELEVDEEEGHGDGVVSCYLHEVSKGSNYEFVPKKALMWRRH